MARLTKQQIIEERREIEEYTVALLKKVKSDFTFNDVTDAIYNETEQDDYDEDDRDVRYGEGGDELSNILDILTDAWNYFPHKTLGGKSPKEMLP
jgi:hypothetical protein